jgi:nucleotide-sensitive chloride channel 1A
MLHAISRDPDSYPVPCLYCQLDSDNGEEDVETPELRVIPAEERDLFPLFEAFSYAASINPDLPEAGEEDGDDELIFNSDEVQLGAEQARRLEQWEALLQKGDEGERKSESDDDEHDMA